MIKSIFYSRFHPEKGSTILHQVPSGSIATSTLTAAPNLSKHPHAQTQIKSPDYSQRISPPPPAPATTTTQPLFSFPALSDYLIPRQEFCNALVTVCANGHRIIGYPVCIVDRERYARNEFIFNFAVVVGVDAEVGVWSGVVRRVAALLREMEEGSGFLSGDEEEGDADGQDEYTEADAAAKERWREAQREVAAGRGGGKVYALCEMILEDLNNYCECMIPLDSAHTLNLKLFPTYPPPPPIRPWHVPLLTVHLPSLMDPTWDLTMQRIAPHINGVHSVARIARLADADVRLVREAVRHLSYYGCCLLLDVFQFAATYAVTPGFAAFAVDAEMQSECARYVSVPAAVAGAGTGAAGAEGVGEDEVKRDVVLRLFAGLRQGVTLKTWCLENKELLVGVDVRRLITFGVIKGFLYRVHKYAVAMPRFANGQAVHRNISKSKRTRRPERHEKVKRSEGQRDSDRDDDEVEVQLSRYLDGLHCFDEICTELQMGDKAVLSRLKALGDFQIIHR